MLVVYMHGIGNHPPAPTMKREWDIALFGDDMGFKSRMAYWADIRYPRPVASKRIEAARLDDRAMKSMSVPEYKEAIADTIPYGDDAKEFAKKLAMNLLDSKPANESYKVSTVSGKILPIPTPLRDATTWFIVQTFIKDVAAYFYDEFQRKDIQDRLRNILLTVKEDFILVTHSLGTLIAYDVLSEFEPGQIKVPLFVTLGSPLGVQEVQDRYHKLYPNRQLVRPPAVRAWFNAADRLDIVAADPTLHDDFGKDDHIEDKPVDNKNRFSLTEFGPHSSSGYLRHQLVQKRVRDVCRKVAGDKFLEAYTDFVVARDVASEMSQPGDIRINLLLELNDSIVGGSLEEKKKRVLERLHIVINQKEIKEAKIDDGLKRYVSADLTSLELDQLLAGVRVRSEMNPEAREYMEIARVWKNSTKRALVVESAKTVHADTALNGYAASGKSIAWAVLDSGIEAEHPHFKKFANIKSQWDCTEPGAIRDIVNEQKKKEDKEQKEEQREEKKKKKIPNLGDPHGHGTHVAGIIAGIEEPDPAKPAKNSYKVGIAPETQLHVYKVLADDGAGKDGWIIKALDHIAQVNDNSARLRIHGINLSLGGPFDPEVFGCGHSPLCKELRRLWRQGVLICIAAGNEGYLQLNGMFDVPTLNMDLSLSDPANLEDCIAVGSVHKQNPHQFGVSHFSSKGPTSDGRAKPDLVAPGERVSSCNSHFKDGSEFYVEMSGTSMASPVVSGILAGFLSVRKEFIGYPDRVKEVLLANCTDLNRDKYHQGAGMPNLVKMLLNT